MLQVRENEIPLRKWSDGCCAPWKEHWMW